MSTITRELAKLFRKITNSEIDAEGNAHVVLSPADSLLINNARIALASLEAEAVGYMNRFTGRVFTLEEQPGADTDVNVYVPVYAAHPAQVSVPAAMEMDDDFDSAFEHGKAVGWNAYRAAMLQSFGNSEQLNSPVIPDGWVACVERMPSAGEQVLAYRPDAPESNDPLIKMATYVGGSAHGHGFDCYCKPTHWMPLPAAPQQEA
ncbi:DUF551 domain-containing protein [Enterobacter hormaechei]